MGGTETGKLSVVIWSDLHGDMQQFLKGNG